MPNFSYVVEIFAAPETVWATLVDVERWPEWTPTVTQVARLDDGPLSVGSRTRLWQPKLLAAVWNVTALDDGLFTWQTSRPGIKVTATHRLELIRGATRVTLALHYSGILGPLMARQLKGLNWDYLTKEAQGLKTRCEQWFTSLG